MIIQSVISQTNELTLPTEVKWSGLLTGNYQDLPVSSNQIKVTTFSPSAANDKAYNHVPHVIEYENKIYLMYATANTDEEEPGQYVRYQSSSDGGNTWSTPITLIESQDDITKGWTSDGRVCIPSGWAIANGDLYGVVDINDKGGSNSSRTGVGVLASKLRGNGTFDTPVWIENVDGSTNAPNPIPTYPSYLFDNTLRTSIRSFLEIPRYNPEWYFSVPSTDILYTRNTYDSNAVSEPSTAQLPSGIFIKMWRVLVGGFNKKVAATSLNGIDYDSIFLTEVPDFPSRTNLFSLSDGSAITGNNDSTDRTPLFFAQSSDGLNYTSDNIYNIDTQTTPPAYSGIFKDTGAQYPDGYVLTNGKIIIAYSINKEDIKISIFDKPTIT